LSRKDQAIEELVKSLLEELPEQAGSTPDDLKRQWENVMNGKLADFSGLLLHRLGPVISTIIQERLDKKLESMVTEIRPLTESDQVACAKYKRLTDAFFDSDNCVNFNTGNKNFAGNIALRDLFVLVYFIFTTCRRIRGDQILSLGITGVSSCMKTLCFETPLSDSSHNFVTEQSGVGRLSTGKRTVLLLRDIHIQTLVSSSDAEKIRLLTRTEPVQAKIHSGTYCVPPIFVMYTSNTNLLPHNFSKPLASNSLIRFYPSKAVIVGSKRSSDEILVATQCRFLEAFCRAPVKIEKDDLPLAGIFERKHAIYGLFPRVLEILEKYQAGDFYSPYIINYCLTGLCQRWEGVTEIYGEAVAAGIRVRLERVMEVLASKDLLVQLREMLKLEKKGN
jgi:hypothetical protein